MEPMTNISQAMPRPNMEPTATPDAGDVLLGYGTDIEPVMEMGFWVPQWGTAYQPRVKPWGPKTPCLAF